jgi:hypothetical protein
MYFSPFSLRVCDAMSERARQGYLWKLVKGAGLTEAEQDLITLVYAVSPRELK